MRSRPAGPLRVAVAALGLVIVGAGVAGGCSSHGVDRAALRYYGDNPIELDLARAVAAGDTDQVSRLVEQGADPDAVGTDDITMAQWAIEAHSTDGLRALLDAGALRDRLGRAGRAPLHDAARELDARYAQLLVTAGADPDVRVAATGTVPLRESCLASAPETLEALASAGADVNARDVADDRPLHVCARAGSGRLVLRLLELGADPLARNASGSTFQDYYFSFDASLLDPIERRDHERTADWLSAHHVRLVPTAQAYAR